MQGSEASHPLLACISCSQTQTQMQAPFCQESSQTRPCEPTEIPDGGTWAAGAEAGQGEVGALRGGGTARQKVSRESEPGVQAAGGCPEHPTSRTLHPSASSSRPGLCPLCPPCRLFPHQGQDLSIWGRFWPLSGDAGCCCCVAEPPCMWGR